MKTNFHTHTTRCLHAEGTDEQYVKAALAGGFDVLGFADHMAWDFDTAFVSGCRMRAGQWADYRRSVLALKEKYAGQIAIRLGMECEYFPGYLDQLHRLRDEGCEYFLLAAHFLGSEEHSPYTGHSCNSDDEVRRYADAIAKGVSTGLYCCVAHPDLFMMTRREMTKVCTDAADVICQAAKEAHLPIEYNLLGLLDERRGHPRGYPSRDFWQYARKWDNDVIIGVDAHSPSMLSDLGLWEAGVNNVRDMGYRIVTDWK